MFRYLHGAGLPGCAGVIGPPSGARIWLAAGLTDLRRGMYGSGHCWNPRSPDRFTTGMCPSSVADAEISSRSCGRTVRAVAVREEVGARPLRMAADEIGRCAADAGAVIDVAGGHRLEKV
jgi:hypothetical protein